MMEGVAKAIVKLEKLRRERRALEASSAAPVTEDQDVPGFAEETPVSREPLEVAAVPEPSSEVKPL